ncbi:hypothetical protein ACFSW8_13995 [Rubritalea tangerina]|uniref:Baseplate protein J-like domain-containing protein n=2 Tax=Rubritalea tangerina TaxID=430798 RepID=A0ABW4ZE82_9BACT
MAEFTPVISQTTTLDDGSVAGPKFLANVTGLSGTAQAIQEIEKSALFELFSIDENGVQREHGKQAVATYLPSAQIEILALDKANGVAKTRVSSPFSVQVTVDGLITNDPTVQDAAKWVNVYQYYTEYAAGATSADGQETTSESPNPIELNSNGQHTLLDNVITQIPSNNLPTLRGEETITVYAQPDFGFESPTELASDKIIVWPLTTGNLTGIENNDTVQVIDNIKANITDLYPGLNDLGNTSAWTILFYKGSQKSQITSSDIEAHSTVSRSTTTESTPTSISNKGVGMSKIRQKAAREGEGTYTVELIQTTVHGIDRLDAITFNYQPTIRVNANLNSNN